MQVKILLFAGLAESFRSSELNLVLPEGATVADLRSSLREKFPDTDVAKTLIAVNRSYAAENTILTAQDEIALIPPVGGGSRSNDTDRMKITSSPLDLQAAMSVLEDTKFGGTVLFCGTVREFTRGRQTIKLAYEAYESMALAQMHRIEEEIQTAYPDVRILQWHRVGRLYPADVAVICGAASPHRDVAFEVAKQLIERLKKEVPIWKKEYYEDGETTWQPNEV